MDTAATCRSMLFAANSGQLINDWKESKNGEGYLERSLGGRPDLQRPVRNIDTEIRSRIDEIGAGFAEKYGWTPNPEINASYRGEGQGPDLAIPSLALETAQREQAQR